MASWRRARRSQLRGQFRDRFAATERQTSPDSLLAGPNRGRHTCTGARVKEAAGPESTAAERAWPRFCRRCCRNAGEAASTADIPQQRHVLVAGRGLDDVAAGREGEVIARHQHAVGRGAVEQLLARRRPRAAPSMSNCGCHSGWRANSAGCCVVSLSTISDSLPDCSANTVWPGVWPAASTA